MPSVITDRSSGVGSGTTPNGQNATISMKVPVKAATTANITLSGAQTIDGVSITAGHRVLVKDQDTASENGIYVAATGAWSRAVDCADDGDLVSGTMVRVNSGTQLGLWYCSSADPINIGSDNIAWTVATEGDMLKSVYDSDDDGQVESADASDAASAVAWDDVTGKPSTFTPSTHTHDDRYYTEAEVDALLAAVAGVPTGVRMGYVGFNAPTGWILANGLTIGNASSNATNRANADTEDLFSLLWNTYSNTLLPIYDSAGSPSTRGASAAADYAADKAIAVPDHAGRVGVGRDNLSGSQVGRVISSQAHGVDGNTLGTTGGVSEHQLTEAELPAHNHSLPFRSAASGAVNMAFTPNSNSTSQYDTGSVGSDEAHTNLQPSIIETAIIKL